jgi:hypothetical protein
LKGVTMETFAEQQSLTDELETEDERVARWRLNQFFALGFSIDDAWILSISEADLGTARSLAEAGCPLQLALQILA